MLSHLGEETRNPEGQRQTYSRETLGYASDRGHILISAASMQQLLRLVDTSTAAEKFSGADVWSCSSNILMMVAKAHYETSPRVETNAFR